MATRIETAGGVPDALKWLVAVVLVVGAIAGFYYWADQSQLLRVIGLLIAVGAAVFVAVQTEKGGVAWEFIRESRTEVRKVVWPTRKETTQTTLLVMAMVAIVALIMWMLDAMLSWAVRLLLHGAGG